MSAMIVSEYSHVFDDVQFGIDVRAARVKRGVTQKELAIVLGYSEGSYISIIEVASKRENIRMADFIKLCQIFDLHPFDYFDLQLASTLDYFKILG